MPLRRRVAITGIGLVTPLGTDTRATWRALLARESGVALIQSFDASTFSTQIAAEVTHFHPELSVRDRKALRQAPTFARFALSAAQEALEDAGIYPCAQTAPRWGVVVGSGMMTTDFDYWQDFSQKYAETGHVETNALARDTKGFLQIRDMARSTANSGLGLLLEKYQIRGYAMDVHTACASGGQALGLALQAIRRDEADTVLAGGFDSMINPIGLASFCLLDALSTDNEAPETASRPFDLTRNGFVLGEGAAFMILEAWDKARARGAKIYAELAGEGNSLSAYRITDPPPEGEGAVQAIRAALNDAQMDREEIDYVNAHGTSTPMNDLSETSAIKRVFGARAQAIPVSSTKSQTGHLIAAAGAVEAAFCALAVDQAHIPMTANLKHPDPQCDLDYVVEGPRAHPIRAALSNSFGFGGSNSCLVFRHAEGC